MDLIYDLYRSFKEHVEKRAFCINDVFYTYGDLLERIAGIREIIKNDIDSVDKYIGLVVNNDLNTYATIFALWMEGRAYVPINPFAPKSRNNEILTAIGSKSVFDSLDVLKMNEYKVYTLDLIKQGKMSTNAPIEFDQNNTAYILFTSGSTGTPKGIPISFKNLNGLATQLDIDDSYKLNASDRCLQMYDLTFDASLTALLPALLVGACVYTVPSNSIKYLYIYKLLEKYKLTVVKMVPSIIYYLRPYFSEINAPSVRYSIFGGEKLYEDVVLEWSKCIPNGTILNHYGPTECTVCSGYYNYTKNAVSPKSYNSVLSIGKPFKDIDYLIINDHDKVLPDNTEGELCISGSQLTEGYWNNEKLNRTSFFVNDKGQRFYKTGDLCLRDEDGDYMYVGRKDFQVKIGGYRVELGEIEYHARKHESVKSNNLLIIDVENDNSNIELILVIEGEQFNTYELMKYLSGKITDYMLPKKVVFIDGFPHNQNGKLDRKKLREIITLKN